MTLEEYLDKLFEWATGWLGWTPEVFFATPVPQIEMALRGKVDCLEKTSPFGTGKGAKGKGKAKRGKGRLTPPKTESGDLDRDEVSRRVQAAFRALGAKPKSA